MKYNNTPLTEILSIVNKNGREFVPLNEVVRLEANGSCTWVYISDGRKLLTTRNLGSYEKLLPQPNGVFNNRFFRSHHAHIINLSYLSCYNYREKYIKIKTGSIVPVSQRRIPKFGKMLKQLNLY